RAQRERQERLMEAAEEFDRARAGKSEGDRQKARVSITEAEAQKMKHGENAIVPSYNAQVSTAAAAGAIVGTHLSEHRDDAHSLDAAMDEAEKNLGREPEQVVADGGFTNRETIIEMDERGIDFIGSLPDRQERSEAAMKAVGIDPQYAP